MPAISVVIPLFNKAPYIERALRSVLNQTMTEFEIIVIDDGSTDSGNEVVQKIADAKVRLICQANAGPGSARNRGIEAAQGEIVAFLDADDQWRPDFLNTILALHSQFPTAGLYATAYEIEEPEGRFIPEFRHIPPPPWEGIIPNFFKMMLGEAAVCTSTTAVPKNIFNEVGLFTSHKVCGEDQELWCKIALRYPICFSWYLGAVYHKEAGNRTCPQLKEQTRFEDCLVQQAITAGMSSETLGYIEEFIQKKKIRSASRYVLWGQPRTARKSLLECSTRLFWKEKWFWILLSLLPPRGAVRAWEYKQRYVVRRRQKSGYVSP